MTFMSTGKILTKAKILNLIAFIHLKKTPEKKTQNQHNSIQFPHFKEFSVLEKNWKGARDVYTAQTSVLTMKEQPIVKRCFINKVFASHGEHTATRFLLHPSYIIYQSYFKN